MSINGKLLSILLPLTCLNTHTHARAHTDPFKQFHSQMARSRSFPQWKEDNWICTSLLFCLWTETEKMCVPAGVCVVPRRCVAVQ